MGTVTDSDEELETDEVTVDCSILKSAFPECFSGEDSDSMETSFNSWITSSSAVKNTSSTKKNKNTSISTPKKRSKVKHTINNENEVNENIESINETYENDESRISDSSDSTDAADDEDDIDEENGDDIDEEHRDDDIDEENRDDDIDEENRDDDIDEENGDDIDEENQDNGSDKEQESVSKLSSNPNWADAMAKILNTNKPKKKKVLTLSRAKKLSDVKNKNPEVLDFEIIPAKNAEEVENNITEDDVKEKKTDIKKAFLMKESYTKGRIKPSILLKDRERALSKIATRGVVQLFNIVRQQQKTIDTTLNKGKKSRRRREKDLKSINKTEILDTITSTIKSTTIDEVPRKRNRKEVHNSNGGNDQSTWDVLKENFMMGNKFKDWDKKEPELIHQEEPEISE